MMPEMDTETYSHVLGQQEPDCFHKCQLVVVVFFFFL